jgi:hypothetical protein
MTPYTPAFLSGKVVLEVFLILGSVTSAWGLKITSPKEGEIFHPGDTMTLRAELESSDAAVHRIAFSGNKPWALGFVNGPPFEMKLEIPREFTGTVKFEADGFIGQKPNQTITTSAPVTILIALPSNVTLQGISIDDSQEKMFFFSIGDSTKLGVGGLFSDGVERDVSSSLMGTTYRSSDEKVATADANGLVTARGVGRAKITVKNGKFEETVDAIVKARP